MDSLTSINFFFKLNLTYFYTFHMSCTYYFQTYFCVYTCLNRVRANENSHISSEFLLLSVLYSSTFFFYSFHFICTWSTMFSVRSFLLVFRLRNVQQKSFWKCAIIAFGHHALHVCTVYIWSVWKIYVYKNIFIF